MNRFRDKYALNRMLRFIFCLSLFISTGWAQDENLPAENSADPQGTQYKHELGIAAGLTTGFGPAYRLWANRLGAQACFTPINDGSMELYSAGLTFMFSMAKTETSNFYLYQGNHFLSMTQYREGTYEYQYLNTGVGSSYSTVYVPPRTDKNQYVNNGIGIGIELFHKDRNISPFGFNLMCGLAGYRNFTRANFTGEIALMYKFK